MDIRKVNPTSASQHIHHNNKERRQPQNKNKNKPETFKDVFERAKKDREEQDR